MSALKSVAWSISLLATVMLSHAPAAMAAGSAAPDANSLYVKKATWSQTMLASRAQYAQWRSQQQTSAPVTLGPWYVTKPLNAKSFADALFPEKGNIDVAARDRGRKALWQKHADWLDEQVIDLPGGSSVSTYLYRIIKADRACEVTAGFGSDDGIEVWLNGAKVLSKDLPRGVVPNNDLVKLSLKAGENQLLMKIYNRAGGYGFYFSMLHDPAYGLWRQIAADFPAECGFMQQDLPRNAQLAWFGNSGTAALERTLIGRAAGEAGVLGTGIRAQADAMAKAKAPADDPRWLDLYVSANKLRQAVSASKALNTIALRRAIEDLGKTYPQQYKGQQYLARLDQLEKDLLAIQGDVAKNDPAAAKRLAEINAQLVTLQRESMLANPLLNFDKLLLVKRNPKQMGLPQNWQGNCSLPKHGYDNEIDVLSPVRPDGKLTTFYKPDEGKFVGDVDLNFNADKMLFSSIGANDHWQIFEIKADGSGLRQVTSGEYPDVNNYDACYRPDGKIIFDSTGCFQGVPCVGGADTVANLFVMDPDGKNMRQLCFDQDHDWCPTILNDGRVMYTRWEYSDTAHYFTRILFRMNPDGTNQMAYYGSNSYWPNSIFYARPIPNNPTKVIAVISGHHGVPRMGELVLFDPAKGQFEADGAVQRIPGYNKTVEAPIVDQLVNASWPKFLHPYPLSDKYFLVAMQPNAQSMWGIYLVDVFDNMTLICEQPGYALLEPVPFRKTATPPVVPEKVNTKTNEALVYISDIYSGPGLKGIPRGTVTSLRISEPYYAYPKMGGHKNIGVEGPWDVRRIWGTVPVAPDGSAFFKAPANVPLTIHPLDSEGKSLAIMRSWFTAMPGETVSCVGCHERQDAVPSPKRASYSQPSLIQPWHGPVRGFSFVRDVQPSLDKFCVGCHDGTSQTGHAAPDLSRKDRNGWGNFTPSYLNLHPYVRRPGPESDDHLQVPMEFYADTSELVQMLKKGHYNVKPDAEFWDRLYTWIDLNVPDHGTWGENRPIPQDFHDRRLEMRTKYALRPEDPEAIPQTKAEPVQFVKPAPMEQVKAVKIDCPNWPMTEEQAKALQAKAGPVAKRSIDLGDGLKLDLVLVPAGEFVMGSWTGDADERPACRVRIAKPFWMGTCEITNRQYAAFDPNHNSGYIDMQHKDHTTPGYPANLPDQPVVRISWHEAIAFANWLSKKTGYKAALPTEAQWEWACRAGSDSPFFYGDLNTDFSPYANLADQSIRLLAVSGVNPQPIANPSPYEDFLPKDNRFNDHNKVVANVGQYKANAWGLFDMVGNVAEWTRSAYQPYPYTDDAQRNDTLAEGEKVVRGGSWIDRPKRATSSFRLAYRSYAPVHNVGFRIIIEDPDFTTARR